MTRIDSIFAEDSKKLMPFVVAGDPSIHATEGAIVAMAEAGAAIIEIGIPFSDPIADGPVIAAAMHRALQKGINLKEIEAMIVRLRAKTDVGLVAMVSDSIVHRSGSKAFIEQFAHAGIDGFIIPDIDTCEAKEISIFCRSIGVSFSMLIAPTTPVDRIKELAELSSGFLYVLARIGLTGEQHELPDLNERIAEIRSLTTLPIAVGFGISTAEHVASVQSIADAAIVGSALVRRMKEASDPVMAASQFVLEIRAF